jgi:hypothetical protein
MFYSGENIIRFVSIVITALAFRIRSANNIMHPFKYNTAYKVWYKKFIKQHHQPNLTAHKQTPHGERETKTEEKSSPDVNPIV